MFVISSLGYSCTLILSAYLIEFIRDVKCLLSKFYSYLNNEM